MFIARNIPRYERNTPTQVIGDVICFYLRKNNGQFGRKCFDDEKYDIKLFSDKSENSLLLDYHTKGRGWVMISAGLEDEEITGTSTPKIIAFMLEWAQPNDCYLSVRIVSNDNVIRTFRYCGDIVGEPSKLDWLEVGNDDYLTAAKDFTPWRPANINKNYLPF